jgi:hypothetical protein
MVDFVYRPLIHWKTYWVSVWYAANIIPQLTPNQLSKGLTFLWSLLCALHERTSIPTHLTVFQLLRVVLCIQLTTILPFGFCSIRYLAVTSMGSLDSYLSCCFRNNPFCFFANCHSVFTRAHYSKSCLTHSSCCHSSKTFSWRHTSESSAFTVVPGTVWLRLSFEFLSPGVWYSGGMKLWGLRKWWS